MSKVTEEFGKNLRSIRKAKGFSQEKLALKAGFDRSYTGKVERGEVNITLEKIYTLSAALACDPKDLIPPLIHK